MTSPQTDTDSMKLPDGKTCKDCRHIKRCVTFGFTKPDNTFCDFFPIRFLVFKPKETK